MGHAPRRSARRLLFASLAAVTVAAGTAIPASSAFAADDYPVPPPPTVQPNNQTRPPTRTNGVEVLGAQVTRGSMPLTGGDVAGLAAIGVGAVAVGAVLVHRSRRAGARA